MARGTVDGAGLVALFVFDKQIDCQLVGVIAAGYPACRLVVSDQVGAALQIFYIAILFRVIARNTQREVFSRREIGGTFNYCVSAFAEIQFDIPVGFVNVGFVRNDVHGATDRIPAKQEALRTTQNFGPFNVVKTDDCRSGPALVKPVLVNTDGRVTPVAVVDRANATNTDKVEETVLRVAADTRRK